MPGRVFFKRRMRLLLPAPRWSRGLLDSFGSKIGDNPESIQRLPTCRNTLASRWDYRTAQSRVHEQVRLSGIRVVRFYLVVRFLRLVIGW